MQALQAALDEARLARGLSWNALAAEINKAFEGTPSIPISVSTLRGMGKKSSVTSGVVLQVLRWLERTPESFLAGAGAAAGNEEKLPEPGPGRVLRFDTRAMYGALDTERMKRGMRWKEVAQELPRFTENMLRNLATGPLIGFPRVMMIPQWLELPAVSFVRVHHR
jgi:hypothetical protein